MKVALKSVFTLVCFCSLSLALFAGQAPTQQAQPIESANQSVDAHQMAAKSYEIQYASHEPTRKGGILILVAGIALLALSPLALDRMVPKATPLVSRG
ncbi:MAG: hypothetical protein AB8H47_20785 [Bacteroidia bacterium]